MCVDTYIHIYTDNQAFVFLVGLPMDCRGLAMRQRILGSHTPPCHRRMVITTQFSVLPCCTAAQTSFVPLQVAADCALALAICNSCSAGLSLSLWPFALCASLSVAGGLSGVGGGGYRVGDCTMDSGLGHKSVPSIKNTTDFLVHSKQGKGRKVVR